MERCDLVEVSQRLKQKQSGLLTGAFPNTPFHWHSSLDQLGSIGDLDLVLIAHEFFDALPVHAFKRLDNGWREILVDYHPASDQFRLITSYGETLIQQVLQIDESKFPAQQFPPGSTIELSPEGLRVAERIRDLMSGHPSSLSLIIDYGQRTPPSFSLRAIRDHHIVPSMFDSIGKADLSADVDFGGLQEVFTKTRSRQFRANFDFQGQFLQKFGIRERALGLCRSNRGNKCAIDHIQSSYDRLVSPTQMGSVYKVLQLEC